MDNNLKKIFKKNIFMKNFHSPLIFPTLNIYAKRVKMAGENPNLNVIDNEKPRMQNPGLSHFM